MSNFDTRFINFLTLILVLGLMSGFTSGCKPSSPSHLGITDDQQNIIGGQVVDEKSRLADKVIYLALSVERKKTPHGFTISQKGICTATAIRRDILLTAAHCVADLQASQLYMVDTLNPWNHQLNMDEWIEAKEIKVHRGYIKTKNASENDIALIKLKSMVKENKVSELATTDIIPVNDFSIISIGYGETSILNNNPTPVDVQKIPSMLNMTEKTVGDYQSRNLMFSVDQKDQRGLCQGDSGGPALFYDAQADQYKVLGVASYVSVIESEKRLLDPNNRLNYCIGKGHYTNVVPYSDWIRETIDQLDKL